MSALLQTVLKLPFNWLPSGMMTYAAAAAILVLSVIEMTGVMDVPGFDGSKDTINWALVALGLGGLRRGVAAKS